MADIIIKNGYILTMNPAQDDIKQGVVVIKDGIITRVAESTDETADTIIDAKGGVVMPGLVNTHTHAGMTLFRGYADDLALSDWLENHIWPAEAQLTGNDLYIGTKLACLEMIRSGTTAFVDMYIHMDSVARAVEESGMRAALSYGMIDLGDHERGMSELKEGRRFVREWNGRADGRITTMYGPHAPHTCSRDLLGLVKEYAIDDNVKIHIHILETEAELNEMKKMFGMCSVNMLDELGFLDNDVIAAHCIWLSDGDMDILNKCGVNVSHNPVSNMKLASGISPVPKMLARGVNVSLGTDGCASNNNLDMFGEMKTAALLHKVDTSDPTTLPARQVLEMATVNGARAMGTNSGMLKLGCMADVIIVDMDRPHLTPVYNVASHLVYSASGGDVRTTIVDGKVLMDDYRVLVMDEQKVMDEARSATEKILPTVGLTRTT
ncbi:MAG TPA: N-ethylammeline chlorohydrolase [Methanosarcinaceae archaeon]|nr:N-ethylammeline chlorohydrolase [Methanosarcinaceae archaeon]